MKRKIKNILLIYKRSNYTKYLIKRKKLKKGKNRRLFKDELDQLKAAHDDHHRTLAVVTNALKVEKVNFKIYYRGHNINYKKYDLIITVGGDGTFLGAAKYITHQLILGVNSAPKHSVGRFCVAHHKNFASIIRKTLGGDFRYRYFQRLQVKHSQSKIVHHALNDVLISHKNPAVLCRYQIKVGSKQEKQRSSGIWIGTPAGSTGAIKSAGGRVLPAESKSFQYQTRELYAGKGGHYQLRKAVLKSTQKLSVVSLMNLGVVYIDGAHFYFPFDYGDQVEIQLSNSSLKRRRFFPFFSFFLLMRYFV